MEQKEVLESVQVTCAEQSSAGKAKHRNLAKFCFADREPSMSYSSLGPIFLL